MALVQVSEFIQFTQIIVTTYNRVVDVLHLFIYNQQCVIDNVYVYILYRYINNSVP